MKLCGLPLATIKQLIQAAPSSADIYRELTTHLQALRAQGESLNASNKRMMNLSQDEWDAKELLEEGIKVQLRLAFADGDPESDAARELARMHERWIAIHWGSTDDKTAYLGLVQGYLADPRFVAYYDSVAGEGATEFLVQAITAYQAS